MQDVLSSGTDRQGWPFCRFTEDVKPTIVCCAPFTHSKQSASRVLIMIEDQGGGIKTDPLSSTHYGIWYLFRLKIRTETSAARAVLMALFRRSCLILRSACP